MGNRWTAPERERLIGYHSGKPVLLQYNSKDPAGFVFCIQHAGNGHYYQTFQAAVRYMRKRHFLRKKDNLQEADFLQ